MEGYRKNYPEKIIETVKRLKRERKHNVEIIETRGIYYLYELDYVIDSKTKKKRRVTFYLGRILENGTVLKPRHKLKYNNVDSLDEKVVLQDRANKLLEEITNPRKDDLEILKMLSNDGKVSMSDIAKRLGKTVSTVKYRIAKLEERYAIRYTIEISPRPFGLFRYYVLVKFISKKPDFAALKIILESYPQIQLVAITRGDYDLFMYLFEENTGKLEDLLYEIRSVKILSEIGSEWVVSYVTYSYGYIPMRDKFFENLKSRIWHRTKEEPRRKEGQLLLSEWAVLYELNSNAKTSFIDIDKKYGLNIGSSGYTYNNLLYDQNTDKGLIERTTIAMENLPIKYDAIFIVKQIYIGNFNKIRGRFLIHMIKETSRPINRYTLIGDIGAPRGLIFISPVYRDGSIETSGETLLNAFNNSAEIESSLIIDMVLVGSLGYRNLPEEKTYQYKYLTEKFDYEVTQ